MKVVFASNFMTHHQLPFSDAMAANPEIEYYFIATATVPEARKNLGYRDMNSSRDYIISTYASEEKRAQAIQLCDSADVVICGSAPEYLIKNRLKSQKLTFRYSERIYKKKRPFYEMPLRAVKYYWKHSRHKNLYLLCASAFTAADYAKTATFLEKTYKWGYFPETIKYDDIDSLINNKAPNSLLWVGRFIDWKHPECAIEVAKRLRDDGYTFNLDIIGDGEMRPILESMIKEHNLADCVRLCGSMSPEEVRKHMEKAQIFLFTSDRQEGWGAVLNESMNSACAVVASSAIGSVPFLLSDGANGFIYKDGNIDDLYDKVKRLLEDKSLRISTGLGAYKTLIGEWNAETAAYRLIELSKTLLGGENKPMLFETGPCSKAEIIKG